MDGITLHGDGLGLSLDCTPKNVPNGTFHEIHAYFDDKANKYYVGFEISWIDDEEWGYETAVIKSVYLDEMSDMFKTIGEYIEFAKQYYEP